MRVRLIQDSDFHQWLPLWEGYNTFYERTISPEQTALSWKRFLDPVEPMFALVAEQDSQLVGIAHYLFHRNTALITDVCYLQDLFTAECVRGQGVGKALIEEVYKRAQENRSTRVYWQTHETNKVAQQLYNKIATATGFIVYRKQL